MNELELERLIRDRIRTAVEDMQLPFDDSGAVKAPQVNAGFLPPKQSGNDPDFPYVMVRPADGRTDEQNMTQVTVSLLIGCYSEEYDGYRNCLLVMDVIRRSFMEQPEIGGVCRFELPLDWQMPDEQPWPQWGIEVNTRWTVATPQRIPDDGV